MEFTEPFKQTGPCCFSPNARYLAVAVDYRLVVRDVLSLKVVQLFSCMDKISYIEWALDSEYILCGLYKKPMIQAWSLAQPEWTCKIDEGPAGIAYARWSPDSRHILTTSEFQLRLTVWSLLNTACIHVQWPKHASKGVSFTKDGSFAAISTRRDCKDYVNLISCQTWEIMGVFAVDTLDLADVEWSPDDTAIVIWDSPLEYKVLIYSLDGRCLSKYQAYESGLGVKSVSWSPNGQSLAVGSYDQMLRVLNHLTWKVFAEFTHLSTVRAPCSAAVFKEVDEPFQLDMSDLSLTDDYTQQNSEYGPQGLIDVRYDVVELPITLPFQKPPADKPNPKQGIGIMSWSKDSEYICTRNDSMPNDEVHEGEDNAINKEVNEEENHERNEMNDENVEMRDFAVDDGSEDKTKTDEENHEINNESDEVNEELDVIDNDQWDSLDEGFDIDRKRRAVIKELGKETRCSQGRAVSDMLLNNLCEVFNNKLIEGRDKPLITCLEYIKEYMMKRICNVIKVKNKKWELIGLSCKHVIAVLNNKADNGEEVGELHTYAYRVHWLETWKVAYVYKSGRPKKKRRQYVEEKIQKKGDNGASGSWSQSHVASGSGKLTRKFIKVTFSKCKNNGHNVITCKGQWGK
ncbi:unnamed protein product [Lactuca saligna]|uniref:Uncharacterized protein n=1 Tax=Lactuca saligna TaxID=75948 RepID=A0AA35ZP79_LACSI|nr:unnamed protein product [Lactuca saligna]